MKKIKYPGLLRSLKMIFFVIGFVYVGICILFWAMQDRFVYHPDTTAFESCPEFSHAEKITYGSTKAYLVKRSVRTIVILYHGNAGRACDRAYYDELFLQQDLSVLFVEYDGYSDPSSRPSMKAILSNVDDTIAYLSLQQYDSVTVIGESIGNGPAAYQASKSEVDQVILITPFTNFAAVGAYHYPFLPIKLLFRSNYQPEQWLANYQGKAVVIVAEHDRVVPRILGQQLYESLSTDEKMLYMIENAGHNDLYGREKFNTALLGNL
jgi:uncharacterized protein